MKDHKEDKGRPLQFKKDHPLPITRRDFLAQGLVGMAASTFIPSFVRLAMYGKKGVGAWAAEPVADLPPFMVFDMAGGGALPGNFLVGKQGGPEDLLRAYDDLGWDPRVSGALDRRFGLPMAAKIAGLSGGAGILEGIKLTASPAAQAGLRMGSFCHFSQADSSDNKTSALVLAVKAGFVGRQLPNGLGMQDSLSGGNSAAVEGDVVLKPLQVNAVTDVTDALSFGPAVSDFNSSVREALASATSRLSAGQARRLSGGQKNDGFSGRALSSYGSNIGFARGAAGLDPRTETIFQDVYGINEGSQANADAVIAATITMNALKRNTGPGVITVSGCDYHGDAVETADGKDRETGQHIGRAVEAAYRLKTPFFFELVTDGGCYSEKGGRQWQGDSSDKAMTVVGYYHPTAAPRQPRFQVGNFTDGQGADLEHFLGSDPGKVAYAVLANYLSIANRLGEFENHAPRGLFSTQELDSLILFG